MCDENSPLSIRLGFTNVFLTECNGGYLLVDTSYTDQYDHFKTELRSRGIDLHQIKYVLLTHHHDDHAGFVKPLIQETRARLIVHENALPNLEKGVHYMDVRYLNTCTRVTLTLFSLIREHTYPGYTLKEDDVVIQRDESRLLKEIGVDGEILYTPGHTDDSITVLMSNGDAFVGDAAMNFLGFCRIRYRPIVNESLDDVYRSWEHIIERGARTVYPSHGTPFDADKLSQLL